MRWDGSISAVRVVWKRPLKQGYGKGNVRSRTTHPVHDIGRCLDSCLAFWVTPVLRQLNWTNNIGSMLVKSLLPFSHNIYKVSCRYLTCRFLALCIFPTILLLQNKLSFASSLLLLFKFSCQSPRLPPKRVHKLFIGPEPEQASAQFPRILWHQKLICVSLVRIFQAL